MAPQNVINDTLQNQGNVGKHQYKLSKGFIPAMEQALQIANHKDNPFLCKHGNAIPPQQQMSHMTSKLIQGLKRKRETTTIVRVPSCTSTISAASPMESWVQLPPAQGNASPRTMKVRCLVQRIMSNSDARDWTYRAHEGSGQERPLAGVSGIDTGGRKSRGVTNPFHGARGRTSAYLSVIGMAVCGDKDTAALATIWADNLKVCGPFVVC